MKSRKPTFFLGANTPLGFVSKFDELYNPLEDSLAYIIKGGPGTGKSGIMKKAASLCEEAELYTERIICSSDPESLDAVIVPEINLCIADGTAPHTIEPKFPGAVEQTVDLGRCWDRALLREHADEIRSAFSETSEYHRRSIRFLSAANTLRNDTVRILSNEILTEKLENYAARLCAREIGRPAGKTGKEYRRFLSALTPKGFYTCNDTVEALCSRIIVIDDEYAVLAPHLLKLIKGHATAAGEDVISCLDPLTAGKTLAHLIIPRQELGIFTASSLCPCVFTPYRRVSLRRFLESGSLSAHRARISFNRAASNELIEEAAELLSLAKKSHDRLESLYIPAMCFDKVDSMCDEILEEIKKRIEISRAE